MKIALLTVFASMALGWLASAGGEISSIFAFFFLPLFLSAVFAIEGISRHRTSGFEVRARCAVPVMRSWKLLSFSSLVVMAVYLLPAAGLALLDEVRLAIVSPVIFLAILMVAAANMKGLLSPRLFAGHLLVFVAGFFIASLFFFGSIGSLFWGEAGPAWSSFMVCVNRGASHVINLGISIVLTIPFLLLLEYVNFRLHSERETSETFWGALSACFFLAGILLVALVPYLSTAYGYNLTPGSFYWEELRQGFSLAVAFSTLPMAASGMCVALDGCSKRTLIFVSSFFGAVLMSLACSTWIYRCEIGGAVAFVVGKNSCSIDCYSKIIEKRPGSAWAYAERGTAYDLSCQFDKAIRDLEQAVKLAPGESKYSEHLGAVRIRLKECAQRARTQNSK
ncbi:MAG: tetratricopeptide repeat protein [Candidatus Obscuribacterales bacterium]